MQSKNLVRTPPHPSHTPTHVVHTPTKTKKCGEYVPQQHTLTTHKKMKL